MSSFFSPFRKFFLQNASSTTRSNLKKIITVVPEKRRVVLWTGSALALACTGLYYFGMNENPLKSSSVMMTDLWKNTRKSQVDDESHWIGITTQLHAEDLYQLYFGDVQSEEDLELIKVQIINRHGARTPINAIPSFIDSKPWECLPYDSKVIVNGNSNDHAHFRAVMESDDGLELYGNCMKGQLTAKGSMQMVKVGKSLGDQYLKKLFGRYDEIDEIVKLIYVRSSDIRSRRTEYSAMYLLLGLLGENVKEYPTIHMFEESRETLYGHFKVCAKLGSIISKRLKTLAEETEKDPRLLEIRDKLLDLLEANAAQPQPAQPQTQEIHDKGLIEAKRVSTAKDLQQWESINNAFLGMLFHGHELPKGITAQDVEYVSKHVGKSGSYLFSPQENVLTMNIGMLLKHLVASMQHSGNKHLQKDLDRKKMEIYLAHDTTIIPILLALNMYNDEWPPFAATLAFELYATKKNPSKQFVKIVYNQQTLFLKPEHQEQFVQDSKTGLIPLDKFIEMTKPYRISRQEWTEMCKLDRPRN
ncbi:hypothetical protein FDP41_003298 [Naegleria fowleri]|uniref:Uncharacterized protein n=1 Tax=Naegleria fowleri TaxID=5763 RepID=A0A6A5BS37_NAEFO|nr:uncharacterized protein FDP41_003298 [Naegleria fowleri]KAF0977976.1 hypothetical protein FDP41_003298 [Naegleria fowleri]CAG4714711.1 unnamed protein product [Naegleria fowleri]